MHKIRLLRKLIREFRLSYNGKIPFQHSPGVRYVLNQFRENQLTDAQKCSRQEEMVHIADTYCNYLENTRNHLALIEKYKSQEKTIKEAARLVGLELPKEPPSK